MADMTSVAPQDLEQSDSVAFIGIFVAGFVLFLAIAVFAQIMRWEWRAWLPGAEGEKSLIHGVKSAVYTFMSNLT
jgi:light-harvesting complex 1 beta chain